MYPFDFLATFPRRGGLKMRLLGYSTCAACVLRPLVAFALWWLALSVVHELAHLATASMLGVAEGARWGAGGGAKAAKARRSPTAAAASADATGVLDRARAVRLPALDNPHNIRLAQLVRHAGWVASVALAAALWALPSPGVHIDSIAGHGGFGDALPCFSSSARLAATLVALDALCSDLLRVGPAVSRGGTFHCGNFGLLLLQAGSQVRHGVRLQNRA